MFAYFVGWIAMLVAFLAIDGVWLGFVARSFYQERLGAMMREQIWFGAAGLFYLLYTAVLLVLVVAPANRAANLGQAAGLGALFGLAAYGTYDVTNLATLRGWPISVALVDMAWGTVLTGVAATVGYLAIRQMQGT